MAKNKALPEFKMHKQTVTQLNGQKDNTTQVSKGISGVAPLIFVSDAHSMAKSRVLPEFELHNRMLLLAMFQKFMIEQMRMLMRPS
jgi:hypothetical protein